MLRVRCNNCYMIFDSDEDLELLYDGEYFKGCSECKTDAYLMDVYN